MGNWSFHALHVPWICNVRCIEQHIYVKYHSHTCHTYLLTKAKAIHICHIGRRPLQWPSSVYPVCCCLMQDCGISSVLAMEIPSLKPSHWRALLKVCLPMISKITFRISNAFLKMANEISEGLSALVKLGVSSHVIYIINVIGSSRWWIGLSLHVSWKARFTKCFMTS